MGTEQERQKKEIDMMLNHEYPKCNIPFEPKPDEQPLPVSGEIRERIAKKLYEQEFSAGYWDVGMSKGDKVKWYAKADSILSDPAIQKALHPSEICKTCLLVKQYEEFMKENKGDRS